MKITELKIAPTTRWSAVNAENPMRCTVKLESENTAVETVLSGDQMRQVLDLVRAIVADAARENVDAFCAAADQIDQTAIPAIDAEAS